MTLNCFKRCYVNKTELIFRPWQRGSKLVAAGLQVQTVVNLLENFHLRLKRSPAVWQLQVTDRYCGCGLVSCCAPGRWWWWEQGGWRPPGSSGSRNLWDPRNWQCSPNTHKHLEPLQSGRRWKPKDQQMTHFHFDISDFPLCNQPDHQHRCHVFTAVGVSPLEGWATATVARPAQWRAAALSGSTVMGLQGAADGVMPIYVIATMMEDKANIPKHLQVLH